MLPLLPIVMGLAQFAPSLMRYFGAGATSTAVAEQVVGIAQAVSGGKTPEEALAAIRQDSEMQLAFQAKVLASNDAMEQAYLADVQNARARDTEFIKRGMHNVRADVMVAMDVVGLIACLAVLTFFRKDIPGEVVGLLSTIAGIFGLCLRDAHQFEFGSSRGSRDKDQIQAEQLKQLRGPAA
ncbi:hypothetical protein DBR47_00810 [Paucibacter sp. KBW04]|uniref:hypothetical protein n=1 Tax=Paucibacter sp. KBW04 TaxID=2153361 RepID=UPI000F5639BE|nr:hypothetical protein [Paucibacter sp. KBW04]RQO63146.1 hypothetical protein DBR47_00810 [Paucibacter sp. KBW04]